MHCGEKENPRTTVYVIKEKDAASEKILKRTPDENIKKNIYPLSPTTTK